MTPAIVTCFPCVNLASNPTGARPIRFQLTNIMNAAALYNFQSIFAVAHSQDTSAGKTALVQDQVYATVSSFAGRNRGAIRLMSTPGRRQFFSTIKDCPEIDPGFLEMRKELDAIKYCQDFLRGFIQPFGRLINAETIDQWPAPQSNINR